MSLATHLADIYLEELEKVLALPEVSAEVGYSFPMVGYYVLTHSCVVPLSPSYNLSQPFCVEPPPRQSTLKSSTRYTNPSSHH
jgi:hypothetical protein